MQQIYDFTRNTSCIDINTYIVDFSKEQGWHFWEKNNSYNVLCDRRVHINQHSLAALFLFWRFLGRRTLVNTIN